ncbi:MAG: gliding motility-associated C-terminal domain-containing protein [Chitinophagaceae bacterium]
MKRILLLLLVICQALTSGAQLCTGSLGDPVIHITFGSGNNPGPPLAAATTNYGFVSNDCPADGFYTVRNSTTACFGNTWQTAAQDHTPGDANGYFMLVNASFQPGDFFVDTVRGLCGNTTYEFAAWIMNVLRPNACNNAGIDPNLTFKIETTTGGVLAVYNTGNLPEDFTGTWKQHGLFFQMPSSATTVVIRITNNAPGGCGNDIALDDITFRPCGPAVTAALAITGGTSTTICAGDNTSFLLSGQYPGGYTNPAFQWQVSLNDGPFTDIPGANANQYLRMPTGVGKYAYRLSAAESENLASLNCRVASNIITIEVNPLPVIQVTAQMQVCYGADVTFMASGGSTYEWTGPNGFTSSAAQPVIDDVDFADAGIYSVRVITDKGCSLSASGNLQVNPPVTAAVSGNNSICEGNSTLLQASGGSIYTWTPAVGLSSASAPDPIASPLDTTLYKVKVTSQFGCSDSTEIQVNVWKKPIANAGPDKLTREGVPVLLTGTAAGTDVSYFWTPSIGLSDANILQPQALLFDEQQFTLHVVSNLGCGSSTDNVIVKVFKKVVVPNAFSPNNDGINDLWQIPMLLSYPSPEITVFNRYGQPVFRNKGYSTPWNGTYNGKKLPVGTYYYVIDLKIGEVLSGWVMIIY